MRTDVYQKITDQIVSELEQGVRPWLKPWNAGHGAGRITRPLRGNGIPYQGINVLMLWSEAIEKGYASPIWMTFKQALELKATCPQGRARQPCRLCRQDHPHRDGQRDRRGSRARHPLHEGLHRLQRRADRRLARALSTPSPHRAARPCSASSGRNRSLPRPAPTSCTAATGPATCPRPTTCTCRRIDFFRDSESYYATLAHEMTHWTRHPSRLDRDFGRKRFGDEGYAMEELVAELGSAFLSADLELTPEVREDHAAYIASWIKVLKDDKRAIFTAASHAQRAADFLHGLQKPASAQADAA